MRLTTIASAGRLDSRLDVALPLRIESRSDIRGDPMRAKIRLSLILPVVIALVWPAWIQAQQVVEYDELGIRFEVPAGWSGQESEAGYLLVSDRHPGFVLLSLHEHDDLDALRAEARQGIRDGMATVLSLQGELESLADNAVGGRFDGRLEFSPASAYIGAVVNPHGQGVTIIAATSPEAYGAVQRDTVQALLNSMRFSPPQVPPVAHGWQQLLKGARLTWLESYGSGGGYSQRREIDLCQDGSFVLSGSSSISLDVGGAFGSGSGRSSGTGQWSVIGSDSDARLRLRFDDGSEWTPTISDRDGQTFLENTRYFRTYDRMRCF